MIVARIKTDKTQKKLQTVVMHDFASKTWRDRGSYMVMARFCLGKKSLVQFLTGKLMYQPLRRISVYHHNRPAHTEETKNYINNRAHNTVSEDSR